MHSIIKYSSKIPNNQDQKGSLLPDKRMHNNHWEKRIIFQELIIKGTSLECVTDNVSNASFADYFDIFLMFFTNPGGMPRQTITL